MPLDQANTWPAGLRTIFEHARSKRAPFENRYYGPDDRSDAVDFFVSFVVCDKDGHPVLIVEAKDDAWARKAELRYRADKQMRDRYALILDECPMPRLWGLSLLGTSMRIYCGDTASYDVSPPAIPRPEPSTRVLLPDFLAGEWDLDVMSDEGFAKVKDVIVNILTHAKST
ncbi:hypothetical protein C8Q76DRAFT_792545 [Earliella scabrosa]|nr:hypothetical protein C8Q76DRAFT_792545 [Earliella scabrosa]